MNFDAARRRFLTIAAAVATAAVGCRRQPPAEELIVLLDLSGAEREWVTGLSDEHAGEIVRGLRAPAGDERDRAARLLTRILSPRARVCAFSHYPAAGFNKNACNGLFPG
jgi:hypothetical protein